MKRRALVVIAGMFVMGVAFAVPPAAAGGGGCHGDQTEAKGNLVGIAEACFTPTNLYVQPGERVTWVNKDDFAHVVAGADWGRFEEMAMGDRVSFRFDEAGIYPYTCYLHPGMNGTVIVGKVKTPTATVQDLTGGPPTQVSNPDASGPQPAAADEPATATAASADEAGPWRAIGFIAVGLILGVMGSVAAQRLTTRRSRVAVTAG